MFFQKYKELDNLCKDLLHSEKGVSAYIESMELCGYLSRKVDGWNDDYKKLIKYRHMRNLIAHENNATEETLCSKSDEVWIDQFYERIINTNDPLALYRRLSMPSNQFSNEKKKRDIQEDSMEELKINTVKRNKLANIVCILFVIIIVIYILKYI